MHQCEQDNKIAALEADIERLKVWHKILEICLTPKMTFWTLLGISFVIQASKGG